MTGSTVGRIGSCSTSGGNVVATAGGSALISGPTVSVASSLVSVGAAGATLSDASCSVVGDAGLTNISANLRNCSHSLVLYGANDASLVGLFNASVISAMARVMTSVDVAVGTGCVLGAHDIVSLILISPVAGTAFRFVLI